MKYGLEDSIIEQIQSVFKRHSEIKKVVLYGSRAKGNYRVNSDIDLTLVGDNINHTLINDVSWQLDDLLLPYTFDISNFYNIRHADLLEHIEQVGVDFYTS